MSLQANLAYSRVFSCVSRYRYVISSGVSNKTVELHFSQLIVKGVPAYVSLMALTITESVSCSYIPNRQQGLFDVRTAKYRVTDFVYDAENKKFVGKDV